jgi:predicted transcriptional regulator
MATTIQLPDDLNAWLDAMAKEHKRPKVDIIRTALEKERDAQYRSAFDGLQALAPTVESSVPAPQHKAAFRKAMMELHAKNHP